MFKLFTKRKPINSGMSFGFTIILTDAINRYTKASELETRKALEVALTLWEDYSYKNHKTWYKIMIDNANDSYSDAAFGYLLATNLYKEYYFPEKAGSLLLHELKH